VGVVLAAISFGSLATMLLWGIVADGIGERAVIAIGQTGTAAALVWAGYASSYGELVAALSLVGALGAGVNAASGRAVMAWFGEEERGFALGIRQMATPLGGAVAAVALPWLNQQFSLRAAFEGLAAGCLVAAVVGAILLRAEPAEDHSVLARPLRNPRVWRICTASTFYVATQIDLSASSCFPTAGVSAVAAGALRDAVLGGVAQTVGRVGSPQCGSFLRWLALGAPTVRSLRRRRRPLVGHVRTLSSPNLRPVLERSLVHRRCRLRGAPGWRCDRPPADVPVGGAIVAPSCSPTVHHASGVAFVLAAPVRWWATRCPVR
jgi:MFS family permease